MEIMRKFEGKIVIQTMTRDKKGLLEKMTLDVIDPNNLHRTYLEDKRVEESLRVMENHPSASILIIKVGRRIARVYSFGEAEHQHLL